MARRSGELQSQCRQLGLDESGTREQMMDRLRDFFVQRDRLALTPQFDVMAAQNAKEWLDYDIEKPWRSQRLMEMWKSPDWVVEPKLDGIRVKAHFHKSYLSQPRLDSRRRSDTNFVYAEQTENFPHLVVPNLPEDTIIDGELMPPDGVTKIWNGVMWVEGLQICTSIWNSGKDTSLNLQQYCYCYNQIGGYWKDEFGNQRGCLLQYWAFDILRYKGEWLYSMPFVERRAILETVMLDLMQQNPSYHIVPQWTVSGGTVIQYGDVGTDLQHKVQRYEIDWEGTPDGRLGEFEDLLSKGGEGVMFKHTKSLYEFKRSWMWVKLKKFTEISAFISGSVPATKGKAWEGLIGAFEVSVMQGDVAVHVASCSAMPLEMRRAATASDGKLHPSFLGRVVEVRYQVMTTRSVRGRHAVMIRFRDDQTSADCLYEQLVEQPSEVMDQ